MTSTRPVTSKPRGVCRYYNAPRGCFAGDKCKFLHGEPPIEAKPEDPPMLTPYDKGKRCRYYAQGFCKKGDACWFLHTLLAESSTQPPADQDDDEACSICFDMPSTYGLLTGCSHIFCVTCIKQWREKRPGIIIDSLNTKKCPMCRAPSKFITPSSKFWRDGTEEKKKITQAYKESMARVPCRYFQKSLQKNKDKPICPYGKDCFYQHLKDDGTPFVFRDGIDISMRRYRAALGWGSSVDEAYMPFSLDLTSIDISLAGPDLVVGDPRVRMDSSRRNEDAQNIGTISYAARRLRDVGRSLEMLNEAIGEGATLESLDFAVEALRAGLGRLEDGVTGGGRRSRRARAEGLNDEETGGAGRDDDDVMERLEILAEQMMASINALRLNGDGVVGEPRADTPPPPLEAIDDDEAEMRGPEQRERRDTTGYGSDDSMPTLRSVSDTSSEGESDSDSDEEPGVELVEGEQESAGGAVSQQEESEEWGRGAGEAEQAHTNPEGGGFVTDGRGRVVWSSEENKSAEEREGEREAGTETGSGTGSGSGSGTGSVNGRSSFMDWLNTLF